MSTSGTVGQTTVSVARLIEHAFRRCGLNPTQQTSETLSIAQNNLFLLLLSLAGRGLNLWCIENRFIPLEAGRYYYDLPVGSISVLATNYMLPILHEGVTSSVDEVTSVVYPDEVEVRLIGITLVADDIVLVECQDSDLNWQSVGSYPWVAGQNWVEIDPRMVSHSFRFTGTLSGNITQVSLGLCKPSIPLAQWDFEQNFLNKSLADHISSVTCYFFDKKIRPRIKVWGTPTVSEGLLEVCYHRQVQDVGALTNQLEVPDSWIEAIIWQLANRMAYELPGVDPNRTMSIQPMVASTLAAAEALENDGAGMTVHFEIAPYTRW